MIQGKIQGKKEIWRGSNLVLVLSEFIPVTKDVLDMS